jgi:serine/threonine-protein kinase RsbW
MIPARQDPEWAISVDTHTARLADIRKFVEQVAAEVSLEEERVFDLKVAVSEACANACQHAGCQSLPLEVSASLQSHRLTFVVTDSGLFHPPSASRDQLGNRGLGLPLMVTLMDEVTFSRLPCGGTRVTLSVSLEPPSRLSD